MARGWVGRLVRACVRVGGWVVVVVVVVVVFVCGGGHLVECHHMLDGPGVVASDVGVHDDGLHEAHHEHRDLYEGEEVGPAHVLQRLVDDRLPPNRVRDEQRGSHEESAAAADERRLRRVEPEGEEATKDDEDVGQDAAQQVPDVAPPDSEANLALIAAVAPGRRGDAVVDHDPPARGVRKERGGEGGGGITFGPTAEAERPKDGR